MIVKAILKSYEELEFAITATAPVSDWRAMLKLLEEMNKASGRYSYAWPLGGLVGSIRSMLDDLDKTHSGAIRKEDQASVTSTK